MFLSIDKIKKNLPQFTWYVQGRPLFKVTPEGEGAGGVGWGGELDSSTLSMRMNSSIHVTFKERHHRSK